MARPRAFDEDQVLEAVMETFWRKGYEGTSAQDLVEATGLGRGSLYAAYASKDGLFAQALLRYRRRTQARVDRLARPGPVLDRLRELLVDVLDADLAAPQQRGCLATNSAIERAGADPVVAEMVRYNFTLLHQGIEATLRRGQAAGELRAGFDPAVQALLMLTTVQGLRVLVRTARPGDRERFLAVIEQVLAPLR